MSLIELDPAHVIEINPNLHVDEHVTAFTVVVNGGPRVQTSLNGDRWTFTWTGKTNDDRLLLDVDYQEARIFALALGQRLAELEPARQTYEEQRRDLSAWLKSLVKDFEEGGEL